jgi:hypothetical protein
MKREKDHLKPEIVTWDVDVEFLLIACAFQDLKITGLDQNIKDVIKRM